MKLASFNWKNRDRFGFALDETQVVDLAEVATAMGRPAPADMLALIDSDDAGQSFLKDAQKFVAQNPAKTRIARTDAPAGEHGWERFAAVSVDFLRLQRQD